MKKIFLLLCFPCAIFAQSTTSKDSTKTFCVKALQLALHAKGFYKGKPTNVFDKQTNKAIIEFTKTEGIPSCYSLEMIKKAVNYAKFERFCE